MLKKNIYKWHRTTSLIIAIPALLWAASGFMHPIMTNVRPKVATQWLVPNIVDSNKIIVPLQTALNQNHIDSFTNFRLVHIDTNWFYQVQQGHLKEPVYLSTNNGKLLPQGEWLYAQYLAKQFLEGKFEANKAQSTTIAASHDCCDAAATCVLNNSKGSKVTDVSTLNGFDEEYKSINKLLPVHRVSFDRQDGIRIYVETTQDRFAFAMDNKRATLDRIFQLFHTWSWLNFMGKGKLMVEILLTALAFITSIMGLYIFFITNRRKAATNSLAKTRNAHRYVSVCISLFTLMFTFSGCYHAMAKLSSNQSKAPTYDHWFISSNIDFRYDKLQSLVQNKCSNISLINMDGKNYWQVNASKALKQQAANKDLMKAKEVAPPSAMYISCDDYSILQDGEKKYATFLAAIFSKRQPEEASYCTPITKFEGEYDFINKRLPVFKLGFNSSNNERYYVETSSGQLALATNDNAVMEGYSFAFLHKHEFMAWGGKTTKDISTMFWAFCQIVLVSVGLTLYVKMKKRKAAKP